MSQQLTVRQQTQLEKIAKAGEKNELSFAKETIHFEKIKTMESQDVSVGLSIIFTKASNLLGIKDPISDINKQDIKEMILSHFSNMSLEEIDYAFKLERYGVYGEKTEHFQLLNSDYVSNVINKYKIWLKKIRTENNLSISKKEPNLIKDMEETNKIHLFKFFKGYFLTGFINDCYVPLTYSFLEKNGFIKLSKEEKIKLMDGAKTFIIIEKNSEMSLKNKLHEFKDFDITNDDQVFEAKKIAIKSCLRKLEKSDIERIEKLIKYEK